MINIIFFLTVYPVVVLMYFMFKTEGKRKGGYIFGIKYSKEWLSNEECDSYEAYYKKLLNRYLLIFALTPALIVFIPYMSISLSIWMVWLFAAMFMFMLPYVVCNRKISIIKREHEVDNNVVYPEIKYTDKVRKVKLHQFIGPIFIGVIITVLGLTVFYKESNQALWVIILIFASCNLIYYLCAVIMDRMRMQVISTEDSINNSYAGECKEIWKNLWMYCVWINTIFTVIMGVSIVLDLREISFLWIVIIGCSIYALVIMVLAYKGLIKLKGLTEKYKDKMDIEIEDEEKHWIWGLLYYNPSDNRTFVSKKFGIGTTLNMAKTSGKVWMIIGVAAILVVPIMCIWMILLEFTPLTITVEDNTIVAKQIDVDYEIDIDKIQDLQLIDELPYSTKAVGTSMDNLKKGTFFMKKKGNVQMFLNPQNTYFIEFTVDGVYYYISGSSDEETEELFDMIK